MVWNTPSPSIWEAAAQAAQAQKAGYDMQQARSTDAANTAAGKAYGSGDYATAATTLANSGDIKGAQGIQASGADAEKAYLAQAIPVFQHILQTGGADAVNAAFQHVIPDLQKFGVPAQHIAMLQQAIATDPAGTLARFSAVNPDIKIAGSSALVIDPRTGALIHQYDGDTSKVVPPGGTLVQTGGTPLSGAMTPAAVSAPSASAQGNSPPVPAGGDALFPGGVDPHALATVESNNNPNAVSSAGAQGTMQVMPATAANPGFGVPPAANGSDAENTRVGTELIGKLTQHYGSPALALVAYNWGPGNTDKWLAKGGKFSDLPPETQTEVGRAAVTQAVQARGGTSSAPAAPAAQNGARVLFSAPPKVTAQGHAPSDAEKAQFPGASFIKPDGSPQYPNASQVVANAPQAAIDLAAQTYLTTGKMPPMGRTGAGAVAVLSRAAELAKQQGRNVTDIIGSQNERVANAQALNGVTKLRANVESFAQTMNANADMALKIARQGGAAGSVPVFNRWIQAGRKSLAGDPAVTRLNIAVGTTVNEFAKIISGSTGAAGITDAARKEAESYISTADTLPQLEAGIQTMRQETQNRRKALDDQVSGLNSKLRSTSAGAQKQAAQPSSRGPASGQNVPTVSSVEDALKLPKGTTFRTPDGRLKVR